MQYLATYRKRPGLWEDCRGVTASNVTILVIFAALAMPGFVVLGDGLAENVVGRSNGNVHGTPGASPQRIGTNWGDGPGFGSNAPNGAEAPDYWGGGEDTIFDVARPGTTPWEDHNIQAPDTLASGFGNWGDGAGQTETGSSSEVANGDGRTATGGAVYASAPESGSSSGGRSSDGGRGSSDYSDFDPGSIRAGWLGSYYSNPSTPTSLEASSMAAGGDAMTPGGAINTVLDNLGAFAGGQTIADLERNGVRITLSSLQKAANGDDPELAAVAEYILSDRALREALTEGGYSMSSEDLQSLASELVQGKSDGARWLLGDNTSLDAQGIHLAIAGADGGNPPAWAQNSSHVIAANYDLLADSTGPNGMPRVSEDTLRSVAGMNEQQWAEFQAARGIDGAYELDQVQGAANAMLASGLFEYLDAPPGMGVEANGMVSREMLLSFSDESQRQGESWSEYLSDDNATDASYSELRSEDGANALDGEPIVMREVEGDLFRNLGDDILARNPQMAGMVRAEGLDQQDTVSADDVVQGAVGDCFAMSVFAGNAEFASERITSAISDNGDGTFTVKLHDPTSGELVTTTVDNEFAASAYDENGQLFAQAENALWAAGLEKGMTEVLDGRNGANDDYMSIDGGEEAMVHYMLTGQKAEVVLFQEPSSENASQAFIDELKALSAIQDTRVEGSSSGITSTVETWSTERRVITATTTGESSVADGVKMVGADGVTLIDVKPGHSYTVMTAADGRVTLRDPQGEEFSGSLSVEDFQRAFTRMTSS